MLNSTTRQMYKHGLNDQQNLSATPKMPSSGNTGFLLFFVLDNNGGKAWRCPPLLGTPYLIVL
jgi:hypothetical protein